MLFDSNFISLVVLLDTPIYLFIAGVWFGISLVLIILALVLLMEMDTPWRFKLFIQCDMLLHSPSSHEDFV